jgi:hypothetical protein
LSLLLVPLLLNINPLWNQCCEPVEWIHELAAGT